MRSPAGRDAVAAAALAVLGLARAVVALVVTRRHPAVPVLTALRQLVGWGAWQLAPPALASTGLRHDRAAPPHPRTALALATATWSPPPP